MKILPLNQAKVKEKFNAPLGPARTAESFSSFFAPLRVTFIIFTLRAGRFFF